MIKQEERGISKLYLEEPKIKIEPISENESLTDQK